MFRKLRKRFFFLILLTLAGAYWYQHLDENHKRFVKNLLSQLPDLPGRYMV
jgi:hypothetical protein